MPEQRQHPVNLSREDLLSILDDIRDRVAGGDSFEGSIQYLLPEDENADPGSFDVQASYRVGNTMGQGGMRMISVLRDVTEAEILTSNAGVLEQAAGIIERVYEAAALTDPTLHAVLSWLRYQSRAWIQEAQRGHDPG